MQTTHLWDQFHLHWRKVAIISLLVLLISNVEAQKRNRQVEIYNPNYDNKWISYGFLIGLHTSGYQARYSERFVNQDFDTLHSIIPRYVPGFSLGFIINLKVTEFVDLRLMPTVAFYEHSLEYNFTDGSTRDELVESTIVEFPLVLKYKSVRRRNSRMYMVGGFKPGIEATGSTELEATVNRLKVRQFNLSMEMGFGFDFYFRLFKFSPELRFSKGMTNMLARDVNPFSEGLSRINTNTISLYLLFQ